METREQRPEPLEVREVLERLRRRSPLLSRHTCWIRLETPAGGRKGVKFSSELPLDVRVCMCVNGVYVLVMTGGLSPSHGPRTENVTPFCVLPTLVVQRVVGQVERVDDGGRVL